MASCTKEAVIEVAAGLGFALMGVAAARASGRGEYVRAWLESGRHGEMDYLAKNVEVRLNPEGLVAGARSVICVADRYPSEPTTGGEATCTGDVGDAPVGRVARYAWGDDYHVVIKKRLHALADALRERWPGHEYRSAVDTAPVLEREHAVRAGLGWTGKHTLLINKGLGSWLLLGEIVTTLEIEGEGSGREENKSLFQNSSTQVVEGSKCCGSTVFHPWPSLSSGGERESEKDRSLTVAARRDHTLVNLDSSGSESKPDLPDMEAGHCGTCTRCIDACPTGCIEAYRLDAQRCISYLTIEYRGVIETELHEAMGDWVAGCDVCQEVCPFNEPLRIDRLGGGSGAVDARYATRPPGPGVRLIDVLGWDVEARREAMRGSSLKRIKLDMMKRNALIAAGHYLVRHEDQRLLAKVGALATDASEGELVRETAKQVVGRLERAGV